MPDGGSLRPHARLPIHMPSESSPSGSSSRGSAGGSPATLEAALERIAALEERLTQLAAVLTVNADGSVEIAAEGQLRLVASNSLLLEAGAHSFEMNIVGAELKSAAMLKLEGAAVRMSGAQVNVTAAMTQCSGVVRCDTLVTNTVVASTYTPGAGNLM